MKARRNSLRKSLVLGISAIVVVSGCQTGPDPAQLQELENRLSEQEATNQNLQEQLDTAQAEAGRLAEENETLRDQLADLRRQIETLRESQAAEATQSDSEREIARLQSRIQEIQRENQRLRDTSEELALLLKMFQDARVGDTARTPTAEDALSADRRNRFETVEDAIVDENSLSADRIRSIDRYLASYSTNGTTYFYDRRANPTTETAVYLEIRRSQDGSVDANLVMRVIYPVEQKPLLVQSLDIQSGDQSQRFVLDEVRRIQDEVNKVEQVTFPLSARTMRTLEILLMDDSATIVFRGVTAFRRHNLTRIERAALINTLYYYREIGGRF